MPSQLLTLIALVIIAMAVWGLITGKVVAGSRGFRANYYTRQDSPVLYGLFICVYFIIGLFILLNSI